MSTHNICFHGEIRKKYRYISAERSPYLKLCIKHKVSTGESIDRFSLKPASQLAR